MLVLFVPELDETVESDSPKDVATQRDGGSSSITSNTVPRLLPARCDNIDTNVKRTLGIIKADSSLSSLSLSLSFASIQHTEFGLLFP